ncbi:hypothetical protein [Kitasatospora sp. A2-31]|uniref:hypothetical protein n=1 Tax=Kitasatospora sp. A2-31 TaxID=2916414 RepID=UPI001EEA46F8|nr:hypothetical protein [Kitasatospora sp. A2-31]MCG6498554.1 hypothetical protein [Kitasatospora sp. A2-31]MCG6499979.1 hypothetical protein [Kitasatospora sp. A2-31]
MDPLRDGRGGAPTAPARGPRRPARLRFDGWIAGLGTASGTRLVVGHWPASPLGPFTDVMVERADGDRLLLAPTESTAGFVAGTYAFDRVLIAPVRVDPGPVDWRVAAGPLDLHFTVGRRNALGHLLRAVPAPIAARPAWTAVTDPLARLLLGVRTRGTAGRGRREWYGVRVLHLLTTATAVLEDRELGPLAPVTPVRFGFGSTPRTPCLVRVTTTVAVR